MTQEAFIRELIENHGKRKSNSDVLLMPEGYDLFKMLNRIELRAWQALATYGCAKEWKEKQDTPEIVALFRLQEQLLTLLDTVIETLTLPEFKRLKLTLADKSQSMNEQVQVALDTLKGDMV